MRESMQLIIFTTSELSGERANETKKLKEKEREKEKNFRTEREKGDLDRKASASPVNGCVRPPRS